MVRGQLWLAKLIVTFIFGYGLAAWCLVMGWSDRGGEWTWVIGVWSGTAVVVAYLMGGRDSGLRGIGRRRSAKRAVAVCISRPVSLPLRSSFTSV